MASYTSSGRAVLAMRTFAQLAVSWGVMDCSYGRNFVGGHSGAGRKQPGRLAAHRPAVRIHEANFIRKLSLLCYHSHASSTQCKARVTWI